MQPVDVRYAFLRALSYAALVFMLFGVRPAAAADCQIRVDALFLNSLGVNGIAYQYEAVISANEARPYGVRLRVDAEAPSESRTVYLPLVEFKGDRDWLQSELLFAWPSADVTAVQVQDVVTLDDGVRASCNAPATKLSRSGPVQSAWRFDDSEVILKPEMTAETPGPAFAFSDQSCSKIGQPRYPVVAKESGWQGTAIVAVNVGTDGELVDAWVQKTSGYDVLDREGLRAAKLATYCKTVVDGKPTPMVFLIQYLWQLG